MATITPDVNNNESEDYVKVTWLNIADGDTIEAVRGLSEYSDRSIEIYGNIDGGTVTINGSNEGSAFFNLNDPMGNALSFSANGLAAILEFTDYIQPSTTGGGASQATNIILIAKRPRR